MSADQSRNLSLAYLMPSQAQKHVTINEAFRRLDGIVHLTFQATVADPPEAMPGQAFLVEAGATGAFSGKDGQIALNEDGAWSFVSPKIGWRAWFVVDSTLRTWDGSDWVATEFDPATLITPGVAGVGIGTSADAANRLAVKSPSVLISHEEDAADPSTRLSLNRGDATSVASVVFQTAYQGEAEFGLSGNAGFTLRVSDDGMTFQNVLEADPATGQVRFPQSAFGLRERILLTAASGTFTPPAWARALAVSCIGGGGGGAGAITRTSSEFVMAGGGGGGGSAGAFVSADDLQASYVYAVGAGGSGGTAPTSEPTGARSGQDGGDTRFAGATLDLLASGGRGAIEDEASSGGTQYNGGTGGGASGGDWHVEGQDGGGGVTRGVSDFPTGIGTGGSSAFGLGATWRNGNGSSGTGYGSGGSGAGMVAGVILNRAGGGGRDGVIVVDVYG